MSRVRMPHNNRVSASGALKTNDIWSKTIGYDPYAEKDELKPQLNSLEQSENLKLLVKMSNIAGSESRGGCKKCGMLGHLTFQCRNSVTGVKDNISECSSSSGGESDSDVSNVTSKRQKLETDAIQPDITIQPNERLIEKISKSERKHKHHKSSDKKKDKKSKIRKHRKDKKER